MTSFKFMIEQATSCRNSETFKLGASPQLECWNSGILESCFWDNGIVGLENQNEYNCIDFLVIVAYFLG